MLVATGFLQIFNLDKKVEAAQDDTELYGYAWSDNIGWISFNNCPSEGSPSCEPVDYSVTVDSNGDMEGAAWSDNIGWIKFGGLSDFPDSGGSASNAQITLNSGKQQGEVSGWARACGGTASGDCSTMESRADGWDGWILLSDNEFYLSPEPDGSGGVTYIEDEQIIVGNAWGGKVVGQINFDEVYFGSPPEEGFNYTLSNTSPDYQKQIERGAIGSVSVERELLSGGSTQESIDLDAVSSYGSLIIVDIVTNNPCNISLLTPSCSSAVTIQVDPTAPLGQYEFVVGGVSDPSNIVKTTEVKFEVVEAGSLADPEVPANGLTLPRVLKHRNFQLMAG